MSDAVDVQTIMQEMRDWIRQGADSQHAQPGLSLPPGLELPDLGGLNRAGQALHLRKSLVGRMPPEPPTFRGRMGAVLVKIVRRSLSWFTSRLDDFHAEILEGFDLQFAALKSLAGSSRHHRELVENLNRQLAAVARGLAAETAAREELARHLAAETAALSRAVKGRSPLRDRHWEVGICGTFDVANYGDLLFPFIAESELKRRLGNVILHRFSYNSKTPPSWPYEVTSLSKLPDMIHRLDGLLIGGGFLIRFDKDVAPQYAPPAPEIHHPTGYWLTPALLALQHNVPLAWNAPGMHCNDVPEWARPLVQMALTLSPYVSVRDELSRAALKPLTTAPIAVVPDTAFGLPRLLDFQGAPSSEFTRLAEAYHLESPYIVLQPNLGFEGVFRVIRNHPERFRHFRFLMLPISPEFGEHAELIDADLPRMVRLKEWPNPLVIAELIGRSEAVLGHSYHLNISALVSGVPVFRRVNLSTGKFTALQHFDTIFVLPPDGEIDLEWFLARVGRKAPSASVRAAFGSLAGHWDRIAETLRAKLAPTAPTLDRFWQSLPNLLENAGATPPPLRRIINLERIRVQRLETAPYRWAAIDNLFHPDDAQSLTDTYPCDHFKLVAGYDGEKGFEYEARALIGMGADTVTHPGDLSDAWRALGADLLSPDYRAALSALTQVRHEKG